LQALRTYGKLLQRKIADVDIENVELAQAPQLMALVKHLMVQSDRVVDLLDPMDQIANSLERRPLALNPYEKPDIPEDAALTPWQGQTDRYIWEFSPVEEESDAAPEPARALEFSHSATGSKSSASDSSPLAYEFSRETDSMTSGPLVGDVQMEMTFVSDVLQSILSAYEVLASEKGIKFQVIGDMDELPGVMICPKSLQEAVSNVLDNALKYVLLPKAGSPFSKNPTPKVLVTFMPNLGDPGVVIQVEDNGPGISPSERDSIFQRGFRGKSTSQVSGTGIGLDISRSLIARMGGRLELVPPGETSLDGAAFRFKLFRSPIIG
jgi:hypothetical protein